MGSFILKRKYFAKKDSVLSKKDWLIQQGVVPGPDGKIPADVLKSADENYKKYLNSAKSGGVVVPSGAKGGGAKPASGGSPTPVAGGGTPNPKHTYKNTYENIIEKGKKFLEKNKKPILIGGGVLLAAGAGYGAKKYYDKRKAEKDLTEKNDLVRLRIVKGNDNTKKKENKNYRRG